MQQGIPGSAPPSTWAPGDNDLGPQAGSQAKEQWTAQQSDSRGICSQRRAPHLWRVTVLGENVSIDISYGSSANKRLTGLRPPIRVTLPGSCDVYAQPLAHELRLPAHAEVTCTPVTSGCCDSECRKVITGAQELNKENADAARFVALAASVVRLGPSDDSISVTLAALQAVSLIAGSALTSGAGYLEFEP